MEKVIGLSVSQQFDVERMNRAIESTIDPQQLQVLAKQLLQAWHSQRAATVWITRAAGAAGLRLNALALSSELRGDALRIVIRPFQGCAICLSCCGQISLKG